MNISLIPHISKNKRDDNKTAIEKHLLNRGSVKAIEKIYERIGRLKERYPNLSEYFKYNVIKDPNRIAYAIDLEYEQSSVPISGNDESDPLSGAYVIETRFTKKSDEEIWRLYMMLTTRSTMSESLVRQNLTIWKFIKS